MIRGSSAAAGVCRFLGVRTRHPRHEAGFTLAELMVVLAITTLLVMTTLPTFFGVRQRSYDRQAQANARTVLSAALQEALDPAQASTFQDDVVSRVLKGVSVVGYTMSSADANSISVVGGQGYAYGGYGFWAAVAVLSRSGTCWAAYVPADSGTSKAPTLWMWSSSATAAANGTCSAQGALSVGAGWSGAWRAL